MLLLGTFACYVGSSWLQALRRTWARWQQRGSHTTSFPFEDSTTFSHFVAPGLEDILEKSLSNMQCLLLTSSRSSKFGWLGLRRCRRIPSNKIHSFKRLGLEDERGGPSPLSGKPCPDSTWIVHLLVESLFLSRLRLAKMQSLGLAYIWVNQYSLSSASLLATMCLHYEYHPPTSRVVTTEQP